MGKIHYGIEIKISLKTKSREKSGNLLDYVDFHCSETALIMYLLDRWMIQ